jgi:hypothetical protein
MIIFLLINLHCVLLCKSLATCFTKCFCQWTICSWTTSHIYWLCLKRKTTNKTIRKRMKQSKKIADLSISFFFSSFLRCADGLYTSLSGIFFCLYSNIYNCMKSNIRRSAVVFVYSFFHPKITQASSLACRDDYLSGAWAVLLCK